jgi:hypothetical protein
VRLAFLTSAFSSVAAAELASTFSPRALNDRQIFTLLTLSPSLFQEFLISVYLLGRVEDDLPRFIHCSTLGPAAQPRLIGGYLRVRVVNSM